MLREKVVGMLRETTFPFPRFSVSRFLRTLLIATADVVIATADILSSSKKGHFRLLRGSEELRCCDQASRKRTARRHRGDRAVTATVAAAVAAA